MTNLPLLIHIGYPKAGSTWLQQTVFNNSKTGFSIPWGIPFSGSKRPSAVFEHLISPNPYTFDAASVKKIFAAGLQEAKEQNLVPVLSEEMLVGNPIAGKYFGKEIPERLHSVFPNAKILIFIREQKAMIFSAYRYHVKAGRCSSIQQYLGLNQLGQTPFGPICRLDFFKYHYLIEYYQSVFGSENVLVLPLELLRKNPENVVKKIINFANANGSINLVEPASNVGLSSGTVAILRSLHFLLYSLYFGSETSRRLAWKVESKLAGVAEKLIPEKVHQDVQQKWQNLIQEHVSDSFVESNKKTSQLIGINLAELGYDC